MTGGLDALVVGVDAGGTATRCVVAALDGRVLGRGAAGGASQRSSAGDPADALASALIAAVSEVDPGRVALGVIGMAGAGAAGHGAAQRSAAAAWDRAGVGGEHVVVGDLEVAFAAGTASGSGSLLLAGTGAVAAAFAGGRLARRCDGYGWLLGDEGSAVWLGLRGLRAVLAALDGREPQTALTRSIAADLGVAIDAQALLGAAYAVPPAQLGRLAPLVCDAAHAGDPVARGIVDDGVNRLLHALDTVVAGEGPASEGPVVVAGSLLLNDGPVRDGVLAGIRDRHAVEPSPAGDGAAGAAALAITRLTGAPVTPDVLVRLTGSLEDHPHSRAYNR